MATSTTRWALALAVLLAGASCLVAAAAQEGGPAPPSPAALATAAQPPPPLPPPAQPPPPPPLPPVGIAFLLVVAAGLCAPLGACCVFLVDAHKHAGALPGGLALAAGVMVFISIYEVLPESQLHFEARIASRALVQLAMFACFFAGVPICSTLDYITDKALARLLRPKNDGPFAAETPELVVAVADGDVEAAAADEDAARAAAPAPVSNGSSSDGGDSPSSSPLGAEAAAGPAAAPPAAALAPSCRAVSAAVDALTCDRAACSLMRTGILVTLALALHNIPEGLATFAGYVSAPHTGVLIAVAIAAHNIPEGICIGIPVYFATGSRLKGILWAAVAGLTEPLGALVGFAVYRTGHMDDVAMAIILGMVAGVMVAVSFSELLPRALAWDRAGGRTAYVGALAGIAVTAVSMVLLALWEV